MIISYFYKQVIEQNKNKQPNSINRLVEIKCLSVIKKIEQHLERCGNYGTASYHICAINGIIKREGYEIER